MKGFIYTGGLVYPDSVTEHPKGEDIVVAADSGYKNAALLGEHVDILCGDFDSLGEANIPDGPEIIRFKPEKDFTDTQSAVEIALERGATEIFIIGGLSGRPDHTMSNLAILENLNSRRIRCTITDGASRIRFLRNSSELIFRSQYKYLSILVADEKAKGVDAEGVKYPLKNATLVRTNQYAVSNEIEGNCALISVKKGGIFIIESRDA